MDNVFWVSVMEKFGIPIALLIAIAIGFYQSCRWIGINMVLPIQVRHMLFLDRLESGIEKICDAQSKHTIEIKDLKTMCQSNPYIKPQEKK